MNNKNYYFTFGFGQKYESHFVIIRATSKDLARKKMFDMFDNKWAFSYTEGEWNEGGISQEKKYGLKELKIDGEVKEV